MFRSLYAKWMALLLSVLLIAMSVLSVLFYQRSREDKFDERMKELQTQALDIAFLRAQAYAFPSVATQRYLVWKAEEIMREFDAILLIFDRMGNIIPIGDDMVEILNEFMKEETLPLLARVIQGESVQERTVQQNTGNPVFTVGVPILSGGRVLGGVFIHTSEQNIEADYRVILSGLMRAMLAALLIGAVLVLVFCTYVTKPLHAMAAAAERFSRGDFDGRVNVTTKDEVGRLAESFNGMAADLKRLEQTRREFVANVSHELRSPLTSIKGFLCGILDGTVPESEREYYLGIVLEETGRLSKLITTLLDLSQIESGNAPLQIVNFDINEAIAQVLIRFEAKISERRLDTQINFSEETMTVRADRDRIEQVLINIIDNAVKHTKENGRIIVSTRKEKGIVRVAVEDTGEGIAAEDLPFIFDRFFTADKARTKGGGTGLGLSIAQKIIAQHGQNITVTSKFGMGSRFEFTLDGA